MLRNAVILSVAGVAVMGLVFGMAVTSATPVCAEEVCPYGDFETPPTPPAGWTPIRATDWYQGDGTEPVFRGNALGVLTYDSNRVGTGAYGFPSNGSVWGQQAGSYIGGYDVIYTDMDVMTEGMRYDLTCEVGGNGANPSIYDLFFLNVNDWEILEGINEADFNPGGSVFIPANFSYTADADDEGDTLRLVYRSRGASGETGRTLLDNVSVDAIPEPSTLALLLMGGLGLAAYALRRRR